MHRHMLSSLVRHRMRTMRTFPGDLKYHRLHRDLSQPTSRAYRRSFSTQTQIPFQCGGPLSQRSCQMAPAVRMLMSLGPQHRGRPTIGMREVTLPDNYLIIERTTPSAFLCKRGLSTPPTAVHPRHPSLQAITFLRHRHHRMLHQYLPQPLRYHLRPTGPLHRRPYSKADLTRVKERRIRVTMSSRYN